MLQDSGSIGHLGPYMALNHFKSQVCHRDLVEDDLGQLDAVLGPFQLDQHILELSEVLLQML